MGLIIGDLRHSIKIKQLTTTAGDYGAVSETYTDLMTLRAGVKYMSGSRVIDSKEIFNTQVVQFTTHYRPAITETARIEYLGRMYRILSLAPIGINEGLTISAELIND